MIRTVPPGQLEHDLLTRLAIVDQELAYRAVRRRSALGATQQRHGGGRWGSRARKSGIGVLAALVVVGTALAIVTSPVGGFEIDANQGTPAIANDLSTARSNAYYSGTDSPTSGDDWAQGATKNGLFSLSGSAPHTAAADCYGSNIDINAAMLVSNGGRYDDIAFICDGNSDSKFGTSGSAILAEPEEDIVSPSGKQIDDIWPIKGGSVPGKDDFSHAYLAITTDHDSPCDADAITGDKLLYLGAERGTNNGDAFWGFEFDQVAPTGFDNLKTHVTTDYSLNFNRTVGDVLVSFVQEGGGAAVLEIFKWNGTTFVLQGAIPACATLDSSKPQGDSLLATNTEFPNPGHPNQPFGNEQLAPPWNMPVCSPTISDNNGNTCRLASQSGGYPAGSNDYAIASRLFFEAAIDMEAFGINDICANNAVLTSRSAHPLESADIKDVAGTTLNVCHPSIEVTKTPSVTDVCSGSDTSVTYTYTVENTGNVELTNIDISDDTIPGAQAAFELANGGDSLAAGASVQFTLPATINTTTTNIVTVDADSIAGANTATDTATATVTAHDCSITVTKTPSQTSVCNGSTVDYTYVVYNNSDQFDWTGDVVDDNGTPGNTGDDVTVASGLTVLANANSGNLSRNGVTITGTVTNIVTADGAFNDPDATAASDTDTATVTGHDCSITVTKTPSQTSVCNGSTVDYTYVVYNNSDQFDWTGDVVDDNGTPGNTGDDVTVASGLTVLANANSGNLSRNGVTITGTVTNIVTADGAFNDPDATAASDTDTATVTGHDCSITVTKTPSQTSVCNGSTVDYTYVVYNNSDQFDWTGDVVDDNGTPGNTGDDVTVASGLTVLANANSGNLSRNGVTITGTVTNIVTADGAFNDPDATAASDTDTATVTGHDCSITVTKTPSQTSVCNGSTVDYTYVVYNNSDQFDWTGDVVDDNGTPGNTGDDVTVASGLTVLANANSGNLSRNGVTITGTVTNIVTADGAFNDPDATAASDTDTATVTGHDCSITVTKTPSQTSVCNGSTVDYTYVVYNNSDQFDWTGDVVDDNGTPGNTGDDVTVASGLTVLANANSGNLSRNGVTITGTVTNIVTADGAFNDPDATAASDTDTATVTGHDCSITVTKTPSQTSVCNGSTVDYTYVVYNNSDQFDWTGDVVDDNGTPGNTGDDVTVASGLTVLANANSGNLSRNGVTITGTVTNIVTADGAFNDPDATAASDTDTATVTGHDCSITVTKTPSQTSVCNGSTVDYTYVVYNNSDQFDWTGDVVDDNGTPGNTGDDVTVASGLTVLANANSGNLSRNGVTITGTVTNIVTADGAFNDPDATAASDTDTATVTGHDCSITVTKHADADEVCKGESTTYDFSVTNNSDEFEWEGSLIDDVVGTIAASVHLDPGETKNFNDVAGPALNANTTNTVTADGFFDDPDATAGFDQDSDTVNVRDCGGNIFHTGTTCRQYLGLDPPVGVAGTQLTEVVYGLKNGKINEVNPGVFFYYSTIQGLAGSTQVWVDQIPPASYPNPFSTKQVRVYDANCNTYSNFTLTNTASGDAVLTINGTTAGTEYIISVKYDPTNLRGLNPPAGFATVNYSFTTKVFIAGVWTIVDQDDDGVNLNKKP